MCCSKTIYITTCDTFLNGNLFYNSLCKPQTVSQIIVIISFYQEKTGGVKARKYLDFLDILLTARDESGNGLLPLEIRNEVDTFLFEGTWDAFYTDFCYRMVVTFLIL